MGADLYISGTLAANDSSQWSGTFDLSQGTLEVGGGNMYLGQFITFAGTTLKLSADTEISNPNYYTLGTVELAGNRLTMGDGGGLTIADPLAMAAAGSEIETRNSDLTPVSYTHLRAHET